MSITPSIPATAATSRQDLFPFTHAEWTRAIDKFNLTARQIKVVEQILRGQKDKQIADALHLSEATVRRHVSRVFARLGVNDRVQLILTLLAAARAAKP